MCAEAAAMTTGTSRGRSIAKSAVWHFAGQVVPLVVAVLTIPVLIGGLGSDRFGVLSLASGRNSAISAWSISVSAGR